MFMITFAILIFQKKWMTKFMEKLKCQYKLASEKNADWNVDLKFWLDYMFWTKVLVKSFGKGGNYNIKTT